MISRIWHARTTQANAGAYESLTLNEILPGIAGRRIEGYRGAHFLRRDLGGEVEFMTILWFDTLAGVRAFAGADHDAAVIHPKARGLLVRFDSKTTHYDVLATPA
jgi:antibiotic biosynthesis monooxygenase (ABM) superfamily enzyme